MNDDVHIDPEQLRAFARVLKDFSKFTEGALTSLNGQLGQLGQSWRDEGYEQFSGHVRRTQSCLQAFAAETAKVVPALEKDAEILAAYEKLHIKV